MVRNEDICKVWKILTEIQDSIIILHVLYKIMQVQYSRTGGSLINGSLFIVAAAKGFCDLRPCARFGGDNVVLLEDGDEIAAAEAAFLHSWTLPFDYGEPL